MNHSNTKTGQTAGEKAALMSQSDHRKKRLAEQLRQNLKNRKAQARQRRNVDKLQDE